MVSETTPMKKNGKIEEMLSDEYKDFDDAIALTGISFYNQ